MRLSARTAEPLGALICLQENGINPVIGIYVAPGHRLVIVEKHCLICFSGVKVAIMHHVVVVPVQLQRLERDLVVANVMRPDDDSIQLGIEVDFAIGIGDIERLPPSCPSAGLRMRWCWVRAACPYALVSIMN